MQTATYALFFHQTKKNNRKNIAITIELHLFLVVVVLFMLNRMNLKRCLVWAGGLRVLSWSRRPLNRSPITLLSTTSQLSSAVSNENPDYVVASLFRFHPLAEDRVTDIIENGKRIISTQCPQVKGTLLVAKEGINGQFCLPLTLIDTFPEVLCEIDKDLFEPVKLNPGFPFSPQNIPTELFPFKKLLIKRRKEILTDHIDDLNWNDAGPEVPPEQWHRELSERQEKLQQNSETEDIPILLDCRNDYESMIGTFAGATALDTKSFGDTWSKLDTLLQNTPKNKRILTFCTGGIRCVKVNAYLKQTLGFENIGRLESGVIAYERWLYDTNNNHFDNTSFKPLNSVFEGKNFLFDRRNEPLQEIIRQKFTPDIY